MAPHLMNLAEVLETLTLLPDWEQRYTFVIELARSLPTMLAEEKIREHLVPGCTSQVWMTTRWNDGKLELHLDSDALIVRGLMALIWHAYNGKTRADIAAINLPELLGPTHLLTHLSPNRRNGFASVVKALQGIAA